MQITWSLIFIFSLNLDCERYKTSDYASIDCEHDMQGHDTAAHSITARTSCLQSSPWSLLVLHSYPRIFKETRDCSNLAKIGLLFGSGDTACATKEHSLMFSLFSTFSCPFILYCCTLTAFYTKYELNIVSLVK